MNRDELKTLGREFKAMVKDFMNTDDFEQVNRDVGNTVNSALDMAFREVENAVSSLRMGQYFHNKNKGDKGQDKKHAQNQAQYRNRTRNQARYQTYNQNRYQYQRRTYRQDQTVPPNFPYRAVGSVSGVLYTVFGSVLTGVLLLAFLILLSLNLINFSVIVGFAIATGVGVILVARGSSIRKRLKRFREYLRLINNRSTCPISELSDNSGYSEKYIVRDLQKMIGNGMLPQAHIDSDKSFVMLNRESYQLYLEHKEELESREKEKRQKDTTRNNDRSSSKADGGDYAGRQSIEEARLNIQKIREARQSIADMEVSEKVGRLVEISELIIEYVDTHPEKTGEVRRFFAYYLPTAIKLLNAYLEFDRQPVQGENIMTAKKEIKDALDTINHAFENLLDSLFENAALDVSADISVLRTILAQDGLTQTDFE